MSEGKQVRHNPLALLHTCISGRNFQVSLIVKIIAVISQMIVVIPVSAMKIVRLSEVISPS